MGSPNGLNGSGNPNGIVNGNGLPGTTSASPPVPLPMPMPIANGFQQQYPNGNGQPPMTPEQIQLFTQHRAQLMYQAQHAAQQAAAAQSDSQGNM